MEVWHIWMIAGIVLMIAEILTPGFVLGCLGLASFISGIASWAGYGVSMQLAVFSVMTLFFFFTIRPVFKKFFFRFDDSRPTGVAAIIGTAGQVTEEICNPENRGRVKIGGEYWKASSDAGEDIGEGERITVVRVSGVTVFVKKFGAGEAINKEIKQ